MTVHYTYIHSSLFFVMTQNQIVAVMTSFNTPNAGVPVTTRGILAVSPLNTINYNDLVQCSSWS